MARYMIADLERVEPVPCPCGYARRAFNDPSNNVATLHIVDIKTDAEVHYHKKMTEIYLILEGELIESDGTVLKKGDFVSYPPASYHNSRTETGCLLIGHDRDPYSN